MRCKACHERWTLECGVSPGGSTSPGVIFSVFLVLAAVGGVAACLGGETGRLVAVMFGVPAGLSLLISLTKCGYQSPATAYQGSKCPMCGTKNWIWPWNF